VDKVFGRKQQCNIDDRLPRGCVLLSDVAVRLGSCNPSAVFGVLGCDAAAPVAGCRDAGCGLAFGVGAVVRGETSRWHGCGFSWPG
jgi:hypothetical protein